MTMPSSLLITSSGRKVDLLQPRAKDVQIEDIAHALSHICRWGGHTNRFYSVAEHCIMVSHMCSDPRWGLLHDAPEAYLGDVVTPLKRFLDFYQRCEESWMRAIAEKFELPCTLPGDLAACDDFAALVEAETLIPTEPFLSQMPKGWPDYTALSAEVIQEGRMWFTFTHAIGPMSPRVVERAFLRRWEEVNP